MSIGPNISTEDFDALENAQCDLEVGRTMLFAAENFIEDLRSMIVPTGLLPSPPLMPFALRALTMIEEAQERLEAAEKRLAGMFERNSTVGQQ